MFLNCAVIYCPKFWVIFSINEAILTVLRPSKLCVRKILKNKLANLLHKYVTKL